MPTEWVSYATLIESAQHLVAVAGRALQETTYEFALPTGVKFELAVHSLEHSLARQQVPQRTIAAVFGQCKFASNDEKMSSVGRLWRDGWRFERFSAQHCIKFTREAPPGAGPSGEIAGLRSYADFACVLGEWHKLISAGSDVPTIHIRHEERPMKRGRKSTLAALPRPIMPLGQLLPEPAVTPPPSMLARKVSRFFAEIPSGVSGDTRPLSRVSSSSPVSACVKLPLNSANDVSSAPLSSSRRWSSSAAAGWCVPRAVMIVDGETPDKARLCGV